MRTRSQQHASRRNGAQSHGPVTDAGKQRSSQNAVKHGLNSRLVVLSNESPEQFDRMLAAYIEEWQPATQREADLVHDIVCSRWRLCRILAIETAALDLEMDKQRDAVSRAYSSIDQPTRAALAYSALADSSRTLAMLSRHETRLRRTIDKAEAALRDLQASRTTAPAEPPVPGAPNPEPLPASAPALPSQPSAPHVHLCHNEPGNQPTLPNSVTSEPAKLTETQPLPSPPGDSSNRGESVIVS